MLKSLFFHGHRYDDAGEAPCPIPGCEDGQVATKSQDGRPAWWQGGRLFVKNEEKSETNKWNTDWAKNR